MSNRIINELRGVNRVVCDISSKPPATLDSLDLKVDRAFGYWFDFGDDWWHQIDVIAIDDKIPRGKYPKVIKRIGESPPQYPELDEDDD